MTLKFRWRYRLKLLTLISIYSLVLFGIFHLIQQPLFYFSQVLFIIVAVLLVIGIIYLWEHQLTLLEIFFQAANHDDFSQRYSNNRLSEELADSLNKITEKFQQHRITEQTENSFLKAIIRQAPVAILAFDQRERLTLFNQTASQLLSIKSPTTVQDLAASFIDLPHLLTSLSTNNFALHKMYRDGVAYSLKLSANHILLGNKNQTIVTIENIGREINQAEYLAWRNLISVLTHEMMNSITPIVSLADNCRDILTQPDLLSLPEETLKQELEDTKRALNTIAQRSQGIMNFVDSYRQLSKLPSPNIQSISLRELLTTIALLEQAKLAPLNIKISIHVEPENLSLHADKQQFEQVLINLINNAADACKQQKKGEINITASLRSNHTIIAVNDNGAGIDDKILEHIFTPFFTTKRNGTGIGMSLTRQIIHAHGGQVSVKSTPKVGTTVELIF